MTDSTGSRYKESEIEAEDQAAALASAQWEPPSSRVGQARNKGELNTESSSPKSMTSPGTAKRTERTGLSAISDYELPEFNLVMQRFNDAGDLIEHDEQGRVRKLLSNDGNAFVVYSYNDKTDLNPSSFRSNGGLMVTADPNNRKNLLLLSDQSEFIYALESAQICITPDGYPVVVQASADYSTRALSLKQIMQTDIVERSAA